jgi:hypothetical protein
MWSVKLKQSLNISDCATIDRKLGQSRKVSLLEYI